MNMKKAGIILLALVMAVSLMALAGCSSSSTHESSVSLNVDVDSDSDEEDTPLAKAAGDIFDDLDKTWENEYHVSYTAEDDDGEEINTVYVNLWADDVESIDDINNFDELMQLLTDYTVEYDGFLEDNGVENGHVTMQLLVGVQDDDYANGTNVLEVTDGQVTYSATAKEE